MSKLKHNLQIIFIETTIPYPTGIDNSNRRYIAKNSVSGTNQWLVFDRKTEKFLSNKQVKNLSIDQVREILIN